MKNLLFSLTLAFIVSGATGQKLVMTDVPQEVLSAFKKSNPACSTSEWNMDNTNYQVKYCAGDKRTRIQTYTKSGTLIVHDPKVAIATLPPGVKVYLDKNHPGLTVDKVIKMTRADGVVNYDVEVNGTDLIFDSKGNHLQSLHK